MHQAHIHDAEPIKVPVVKQVDRLTWFTGALSAAGLILMTAIVCWEVFSRYVLNEPTYWGSDVAVYILVGMTFLGLAQAQRAADHVRVELVIAALSSQARARFDEFASWLGLGFVLFAGWQMAAFNYQEYVNDTRDWGLLGTPQWIPELFVTLGYIAFAWAILADILRSARPLGSHVVAATATFVVLGVALLLLGDEAVRWQSYRIDAGSALILIALWLGCLLVSGLRMAFILGAVIGVSGVIYWLAGDWALLAIGVLMVTTLFGLLLTGVQVAISLGTVGLLGLIFLMPTPQLSLLAERSWNAVNTFTLTAVPMFVLMGALLIRSGVTKELFDSLSRWCGQIPGGLGHAAVGASAVFAAVSGSSLATAATMGKVACPEMIERGYSVRLTYGVVAAGATLGILIPPSIAMIIYGTTVGVPVTQLFAAGVIPGILLSLGFMGCVAVWSVVQPDSTPQSPAYSLSEKVAGSVSVLPFLFVIVAVLGSLYAGVATPTEAGGVGAASSLLICATRRMLTWRMLWDVAIETVRITSFLLLIVVGAAIMSWVFDFLRIPRSLVAFIEDAEIDAWQVVVLVALIYVVLGMFIESISMMLMTLPVTFPIMMSIGIDPLWFGIFLVIMIEVGLVTPPVGIILFILRGVSGDVDIKEIVLGVLPFLGVTISFVVLIYMLPEIVLWLPSTLK